MFDLSLQCAEHIKRFSVSAASPSGWEVRLEEDSEVRHVNHYEDWHRVERGIANLQRVIRKLTETGWRMVEA